MLFSSLLGHRALEKERADKGADRPANNVLQFLKWSPAAGTNAAVNWRDCGMSRWQLSNKITTIAAVHVRGAFLLFCSAGGGYWPDSAAKPDDRGGCFLG
jgi:hypothetical protein